MPTSDMSEGRTEKQNRFIDLRVKGLPYSQIAKELSVSKATLRKHGKAQKSAITQSINDLENYRDLLKALDLIFEKLKN
ncbi:MAG: hypothetical protein LBS61_02210 [Endomicrobium sp.]|jgi:transcriptional regulator|nr:hypothetical protein [Endomicrobium sp.]